ncbi:MAG: NAD(+) synthase [Clostridia bacterium]
MLKQFGFVRVSAVSPELKVADISFNVQEIIKQVSYASNLGSQILTFPELCLTGYTCGDLFLQDILIKNAEEGLERILTETSKLETISILGMPLRVDNQLFNVAVVINKGKILGVVPKTYIPNYSEFYEKRYFATSQNALSKDIQLLGQIVPFGTDLIFKDKQDKDICFAIEICEDLWSLFPPSTKHTLNGASMIFNLSASNEIIGKYEYRKNLVKGQSSKCICAYVYASCGTNESTCDVVFSGHSMIAENGIILAESERFKFESQLITQDVDIKRLMNLRYKDISYMGVVNKEPVRQINFELTDTNKNLLREYEPNPFVPADELKRNVRCSEILNIQSCGLAKRLKYIGSYKTVIGISGGLDSTLAFLVIIEAYKKLGISNDNIIAVTMPGFGTSNRTYNNTVKLIKSFGANFKEIDIKPACLQHLKDIGHDISVHDVTYENVQARERTQILMDIGNKNNAIVVGTGDLSEQMLGWSTYNGDHMSMYSVNNSIPKTLVKYLVRWAADLSENEECKKTIYDILDTPISPELLPTDEKGAITQKTESVVGPYVLHDFFTYHFLRYGAEPSKILLIAEKAFKGMYTKKEILHWLKYFIKRFFNNQFKRNCVPDGPKVGTISISPRGDLRMPSDAESSLWLADLADLE